MITEIFFKCTLVSDVVLNSKLATEGNMTTLNYIPGSNFLGIVAKELYENIRREEALQIFHSKEVSFGDAYLSKDNEIYYPVPFDFMMVKGEDTLGDDSVYLQHLLEEGKIPKDGDGFKLQLKQKRNGLISASGKTSKEPEKNFSLKSAQDASTRRSKEGAMFGFESLKAGQEFIFSVKSENQELLNKIEIALKGRKRIGKSKSAEFGQVDIEPLSSLPKKIPTFESNNFSLVYAQSDLCFFDENFGQPTFQPTAKQMGLNGDIDWSRSQIRTYNYSPWNGHRNTTDAQRNCISAGSVFYLNKSNVGGEFNVGEFQAEGLGRIIVNPVFLKGDDTTALLEFNLVNDKVETAKNQQENESPKTELGKYLLAKKQAKKVELELSAAVNNAVKTTSNNLLEVSTSQWGAIRNYAIREQDVNKLFDKLFLINSEAKTEKEKRIGYLTYGVAYDKIWSKNRDKPLIEFEKIFKYNQKYGSDFIAKYAAEISKRIQKENKEKSHGKK